MPMRQQALVRKQTKMEREAAAMSRQRAATFRKFNNALRFWQVCENALCRRRHRCSGDAHDCITRRWHAMPEEEKEYWRGAFKASRTASSAEDMHRAGLAARTACLHAQAPLDRPSPAPASAQPAPAAPAADARIRRP